MNNLLPMSRPTRRRAKTVEIKRVIRSMRGGSQARLVEGDDGRFYVCKFAGNPQGNRTLINEWVTQSIMAMLDISTPSLCVLKLPDSLRDETLYFEVGNKKVPVEGQWHLGSLCPVNPEEKPIFDFLPEKLLRNVSNLDDFGRAFVVDRWLYQSDQRQAIFVRDRTLSVGETRMKAYFIDNGMAFDGSSWQLREAIGHGLYMDRKVYDLVDMPAICNQTVSQIESLSERQIFSSFATLPECWLSTDDRDELNRLLMNLHKKRLGLRRIVTNQLASMGRDSDNNELEMLRKGMGSVQYHAAARNACYGS